MSDDKFRARAEIEAAGFPVTLLIVPRRGMEAMTRWLEIKTEAQADLAGRLSETAIAHYFERELQECGEPLPHRWFMLVDFESANPARVVLCVPGKDVERSPYKVPFHTTGYRNQNPYQAGYEGEINWLAKELGIDIPRNWMGRLIEDPAPSPPAP